MNTISSFGNTWDIMGFQPTRQLLILGGLTTIFRYLLDRVRLIILLRKTNIQKRERKENKDDSIMNQRKNINK